jgi:integrase
VSLVSQQAARPGLMIATAVTTCMRISEILALQWKRLNLDRGIGSLAVLRGRALSISLAWQVVPDFNRYVINTNSLHDEVVWYERLEGWGFPTAQRRWRDAGGRATAENSIPCRGRRDALRRSASYNGHRPSRQTIDRSGDPSRAVGEFVSITRGSSSDIATDMSA